MPVINEGPGVLGQVPMIWAGATDFDLWRQYGYKPYGPVNKPFFKDGPSQCAPYAQMVLTRFKKDAVRGTLMVAGNEYYQLGDVVYVNCRDLLYYVVGIKHNFSYASGGFTTILDLRLGHPMGEYIPTPMDVVGKLVINNQVSFNNVMAYRKTASKNNGALLASIKFDRNSDAISEENELKYVLQDKYDLAQLKNSLLEARNILFTQKESSGYPKIEIRGFCSSNGLINDPISANKALTRINAIRSWFKNPRVFEGEEFYQLSTIDFPPLDDNAIEKIDGEKDPVAMGSEKRANTREQRVPSDVSYQISKATDYNDVVEVVVVFKSK
jgi:hypothetical protein